MVLRLITQLMYSRFADALFRCGLKQAEVAEDPVW
jgi:hypothetical protein